MFCVPLTSILGEYNENLDENMRQGGGGGGDITTAAIRPLFHVVKCIVKTLFKLDVQNLLLFFGSHHLHI